MRRAGRELRDGRGYKQLAPLFYQDGWIFHGTHSCLSAARSAFTTPRGWWKEGSPCGSGSDHDFGLCFVEMLGFVWVRCVPVRHPEHGQIPNAILCVEDKTGWQHVQDRSMNTGKFAVLDRRTPGCWNKICICVRQKVNIVAICAVCSTANYWGWHWARQCCVYTGTKALPPYLDGKGHPAACLSQAETINEFSCRQNVSRTP